MPHFCCSAGCWNKSNKHPGLSYYHLPKIPPTRDDQRKKLMSERRDMWLSRIARTHNSNPDPDHWKVCGRHFITGRKTKYLMEQCCTLRQRDSMGSLVFHGLSMYVSLSP